METKHTPDKWEITLNDDKTIFIHAKKPTGYTLIAILEDPICGDDFSDEIKANAKLIAAAPDLLHELKENLFFLKALKERVENKNMGFDEWVKFVQLDATILSIENAIKKSTE